MTNNQLPVKMSRINVLMIEDDEIDRMAVKRAFRDLSVDAEIVEALDGREALNILKGEDGYAQPNQPFLILLDLNMPQVSGIEFLKELRSPEMNPVHRNAIVFVLTTSMAEHDIEQAYAHNIAGYLVKSDYDDGLASIVKMLTAFSQVVEFPFAKKSILGSR